MLVVIPARGGSKGVPGKNIKELHGKPLIAYTIEAALHAQGIHRVVVSTDSKEIAEVARRYGAEVPFLRPAYLADDTASAVDVYIHIAEYMMEQFGEDMSKFMVLLPTAPLRDEGNIEEALAFWKEKKASTLISMTEADVPISWYYVQNDRGYIENAGFDSANAINNRQVNRKYYIPNGAIYILDYNLLKKGRTYYDDNTVAYIMNKEKSIDIDTIWDFEIAEYQMERAGRNI